MGEPLKAHGPQEVMVRVAVARHGIAMLIAPNRFMT